MMKRILLAFLDFYGRWISPAVRSLSPATSCRYQPTCSQYAREAIQVHGAARGGWMALRRLLRCHPFGRGDFDPVPLPQQFALSALPAESLHDPLQAVTIGRAPEIRRAFIRNDSAHTDAGRQD